MLEAPRVAQVWKEREVAKILVACSAGTYIRSIAYDLGKKLYCGGYLTELTRTKAGKFALEDAANLNDITDRASTLKKLISPIEVMDKTICLLSDEEAQRVGHGMPIKNKGYKNSDIVIFVYSGKIHGVGLVADDKILAKKVFEVL